MSSPSSTPITVAHGDGIGPEIMDATLRVLEAAGARLDIETIEIGEAVYARGNPAGIEPESLESLRRTGVFLKAPITKALSLTHERPWKFTQKLRTRRTQRVCVSRRSHAPV